MGAGLFLDEEYVFYAFGMLNRRKAGNVYMIGNVFFNLIVTTFMSYICWRASVILDIVSVTCKEFCISVKLFIDADSVCYLI